MKQPLALLLLIGAAIPLVFADSPAVPVVPPQPVPEIKFTEPDYSAYKSAPAGGYVATGTGVEPRCVFARVVNTVAMVRYPVAGDDLGRPPCKHHAWKLLMTEGDKDAKWNKLYVPQEAGKKDILPSKLEPINVFFLDLDTAYKAVQDAAKAVIAANGKPEALAKLWANNKPAGDLLKYYRAFAAFEGKLQNVLKDPTPINAPAPDSVTDAYPPPAATFKVLEVVDEVLRKNLADLQVAVAVVRGAAKGDTGGVKARLGTDLTQWNKALAKGGDYQTALDQIYTGDQARAAREALAGAKVVDDGQNRWVMQEIVVPGKPGKEPLVKTAKFVRLTENSTPESVARELMDSIKADDILNKKWSGFKAAVSEVVAHPVEAVQETAHNIAVEQGPLAFMSGQTKPDMQKKINQAAATDSANALKNFTTNDVALKAEFERSWSACAAKWAELKRDKAAFAALPPLPANAPQAQREAIRKELDARPGTFKADGPKGAKDALVCTDGGAEIQAAFFAARDKAIADVNEETGKIATSAGLRQKELDDMELYRMQFRRYYLRLEVRKPELRAYLAGLVKSIDNKPVTNSSIKAEVVESYFTGSWSLGDKKERFYLDGWNPEAAGWKPVPLPPNPDPSRLKPLPKAAYDWMDKMKGDPRTPKEKEFLDAMERLHGFWRKGIFESSTDDEFLNATGIVKSGTVDDKLVMGEVKPWVKADFARICKCTEDPKREQGGGGGGGVITPLPPAWNTPLEKPGIPVVPDKKPLLPPGDPKMVPAAK